MVLLHTLLAPRILYADNEIDISKLSFKVASEILPFIVFLAQIDT